MLKKFYALGLIPQIISITVVVLLTVVTASYVVFVSGYNRSANKAMVKKAAAFTAVADEAKSHVAALNKTGAFDAQTLLDELKTTLDSGKPYADAKIFGTIPVVAGWTAAENAAGREDIVFSITSYEARNKKNEPNPTSFEGQLLTDLTAQVNSNGSDVIHRVDEATNTLHYMRAIKLTDDCMLCHGDPKDSLSGDGKDPIGFAMENWKPGKMHGSYHVKMPLGPVDDQVADFIGLGLLWTAPLAIACLVGFIFLLKAIFKASPLTDMLRRVKDIAQGEGDLTQRVQVTSQDQVGQLGTYFNQFIQKVHDLIAEVTSVTTEVASAATEIAASSEEMASGMTEQNQQITEISTAVNEMSSSLVEVSRRSTDATSEAQKSGEIAIEGGEVVSQTVENMESISEAVSASSASVTTLGKRGEEIGQIIEVINDIADQTNLLALNAAIEAARAGEHGRGFAVVADEVRKLADRTTKATDEISNSITLIQTETSQAVDRMNSGTSQVEKGVERATNAGESLKNIVNSTQNVTSLIQEIAAATEQQTGAANLINENVQSVAAITSQSTDATNQAAITANLLSQKSEQLQSLVGQFKINGSSIPPTFQLEEPRSVTSPPPSSGISNDQAIRDAAKSFKQEMYSDSV